MSVAFEISIRGDGPWKCDNTKTIQEKALRSNAATQGNIHHILKKLRHLNFPCPLWVLVLLFVLDLLVICVLGRFFSSFQKFADVVILFCERQEEEENYIESLRDLHQTQHQSHYQGHGNHWVEISLGPERLPCVVLNSQHYSMECRWKCIKRIHFDAKYYYIMPWHGTILLLVRTLLSLPSHSTEEHRGAD